MATRREQPWDLLFLPAVLWDRPYHVVGNVAVWCSREGMARRVALMAGPRVMRNVPGCLPMENEKVYFIRLDLVRDRNYYTATAADRLPKLGIRRINAQRVAMRAAGQREQRIGR